MIVGHKVEDLPDLYTVKEAARWVNVLNEYKIRRMIKDGIIKAYKIGNRIYVTREDVIRAVYGNNNCCNSD